MVVRLGLVSDSHYNGRSNLPKAVELLTHMGVSQILHAGDLGDLPMLRALEKIAPVQIVAGNCDSLSRAQNWGRKKIIELEGMRIGLIHGDGTGGTTPDRAFKAFKAENVNAIVFGHSHQPLVETREGILMVNPGSCKLPKGQDPRPSFALLFIDSNEVRAEIIYFVNS